MKESKLFKSFMATLIVLVGPSVALASTSDYFDGATETTVSYADLNLERIEDEQVLYLRLQQASKKVCNIRSPMTGGTFAWRACYSETLANAIDKFGNEDLVRIHAK